MNKPPRKQLFNLILLNVFLVMPQVSSAGLALTPGVTTELLDKIDLVENQEVQVMLKSAVWPGYGNAVLELDRPDSELSDFEKKYKEQPLTWNEKIENVEFILNQNDPKNLNFKNLEYKDIAFGEAVIPVPDRRVQEIYNTFHLEEELNNLEREKLNAIAKASESNLEDVGQKLQTIEDEYAQKLALLMATENEYKKSKVDYLKISNQKKHGRISDEIYQQETRQIVEDFERFFEIGSETGLFSEEKIKQISSSLYEDPVKGSETLNDTSNKKQSSEKNTRLIYWVISVFLMVISITLAYFGLKRIKK